MGGVTQRVGANGGVLPSVWVRNPTERYGALVAGAWQVAKWMGVWLH